MNVRLPPNRVPIRSLALAAIFASLTSCSKHSAEPPSVRFGAYNDSENNFRFEAPLGWRPDAANRRPNQPMVSVFVRGNDQLNGQTVPVDVALSVTKLSRRPQDFSNAQDYDRFRRTTLLQVDALFGPPDPELQEPMRSLIAKDTKDITVDGIEGKTYRRNYDYVGNAKAPPLAVSVEDVVLRTQAAYYVLEYRARRDLFDKYHFAADHLLTSFHPG